MKSMGSTAEGSFEGQGTPLPATFSRRDLLELAVAAEDECDRLRQENKALRPKADFYDRVTDTDVSFSLGETAKLLAIPGLGRNTLIQFLRDEGILMANNVAKQRYIDRGYFHVVQRDFYGPDGALRIKAATRVREKGIEFIRRRLDEYLKQFMERQNAGY